MRFNLKANGADSLKSAFENIEKLNDIMEGGEHRLKDAVIFLNHGVELLLKYILRLRSNALIFENIDQYLKAKEALKKRNDSSKTVFDMDQKLRTVGLLEAIKRIEYLCDIDIPKEFNDTILYVNKIRNNIMHYQVDLTDEETILLVSKLQVCYEEAVKFLETQIDDLEDYIQDSRFELTYEEYQEQHAEMWAEMHMEDMIEEAMREEYEEELEKMERGTWYT
ncbi:hypothetical protein GKZ89_08865 [Bacillus mangrovi]|uniref:Uncharacterized protein n=1 Tax=Metabacillus mangrovi TaxID=1491830 RepID=A0A7X2S5B0_9BACI|nr:hypothetical protein [Metabacillus mangrovi]MTH53528.1 hypothetical protein [Metabacillus mangrovi]